MKSNLSILLFILLFPVSSSFSAPFNGREHSFFQPDSSEVRVRLFGDETYMRAESLAGYSLIRDKVNGWICFAELSKDKQRLLSTGVFYTPELEYAGSIPELPGLEKHLDIDRNYIPSIQQKKKAEIGYDPAKKSQATPVGVVRGEITGIAIIVDFSDFPRNEVRYPISEIERSFNADDFTAYGNNGSLKQYFSDFSGGLLEYENFVFGYFRAPKAFAVYDGMPYGEGAREILGLTLQWIKDQGFDFSKLTTRDGKILALSLLHTGHPKTWAEGMWSHSGWYTGFTINGVKTERYTLQPIQSDLNIETFVHESGHMICDWPDVYRYDGADDNMICIMGGGGGTALNPAPPNPHFRNLVGWTRTEALDEGSSTIQANNYGVVKKFTNINNPNEFFLIEAVKKSGRYKDYPTEGLMIWHINDEGDQQTDKREIFIKYANNNPKDKSGYAFRDGLNTKLTNSTFPNSKWLDNSSSGVAITNISRVGDEMSFKTILDFPSGCAAPNTLDVVNVTNESAKIIWEGTNVPDYYLWYKRHNGSWTAGPSGLKDTVIQLNNLLPGTEYLVDVYSNCPLKQVSRQIAFKTRPECQSPINPKVTNILPESARITWDDSGSESYSMWIGLNNTNLVQVGPNIEENYFDLTGLDPKTKYYLEIHSNCSISQISSIDFTTMEIDIVPPSSPTALKAESVRSNGCGISWNPSTDNVSVEGYEITSGDNWIGYSTIGFFSVGGLMSNSEYTFTVRAKDQAGNFSDPAQIQVNTTPECIAPVNMEIIEISSTSAKVTWADSYAPGYNVWIMRSGGSWVQVGFGVRDTFFNFSGLLPNVSYTVDVWSRCEANWVSNRTNFNTRPTSINNDQIAGYKIYPNPGRDIIYIEGKKQSGAKVKLINLYGAHVKSFLMENYRNEINISDVPPGMYFICISDESGTFTQKINIVGD